MFWTKEGLLWSEDVYIERPMGYGTSTKGDVVVKHVQWRNAEKRLRAPKSSYISDQEGATLA